MLQKLISGGQTGVDRAALDVALELGIPCGGWCPLGRLAEDGTILDRYPLLETATPDYAERTRANVRDSDGTLIIAIQPLTGGTAHTAECARELDKPILILAPGEPNMLARQNAVGRGSCRADASATTVTNWIARNNIHVLNVAGPRESTTPGAYAAAHAFLTSLLGA